MGDTGKKNKRTKVILPWDVSSFFSEQVPERDDDDDEDEEEMNAATILRLKTADERTKNMTKEEYVHYSECRQASFTFRKAKRFREWAGFHLYTESKPNDDIVDILGFLTFEIVQTLTEEALQVKAEEEKTKSRNGDADVQSQKRKMETGLFGEQEEGRTPVGPKHIQEAFRRLQEKPIPGRTRVWMGGPRSLQRKELRLVSTPSSATEPFTDCPIRSDWVVSDLNVVTGIYMALHGKDGIQRYPRGDGSKRRRMIAVIDRIPHSTRKDPQSIEALLSSTNCDMQSFSK